MVAMQIGSLSVHLLLVMTIISMHGVVLLCIDANSASVYNKAKE